LAKSHKIEAFLSTFVFSPELLRVWYDLCSLVGQKLLCINGVPDYSALGRYVAQSFLAIFPAILCNASVLESHIMSNFRLSTKAAAGLGLAFILSAAQAAHAQLSFTVGTSVEGARLASQNSLYGAPLIPPDTSIAVGTSQVISYNNGRYLTYTKSGSLVQSQTDTSFWANNLQTGDYLSDTRQVFDAASGRYFVSAISIPKSGAPNAFLLGVSKTDDILDGFNTYSIDANANGGNNFADYTQLGVNGNGIYLSSNNFNNTTGKYAFSNDVVAVDKAALLAGTVNSQLFVTSSAIDGFTSHPVIDLDGGKGPAFVLSDSSTSFDFTSNYLLSSVNKTATGFSYTDAGPGINNGTFYDGPNGADQKGSAKRIDSGDTRLSGDVIQRGGKIYSIQTVADPTSGKSDLHYAIIDAASKTLITDGLIADPNLNYYYGSLSVNKFGDIVVGMSGSGAPAGTFGGQYASAYTVVGKFDGTTAKFGTASVIQQGLGKYDTGSSSNPMDRIRWGDWSQTAVDPNDPYSFWTAQEYATGVTFASGADQWAVRLVNINLTPVPEMSTFVSGGAGFLGLGLLLLTARKRRRSVVTAE